MTAERLTRWAWALVAYNLLVVAFGAFVRASFSGDGCGSHWPLCDGQVIPDFASYQRVIEFSHRVSSGLVLPFVLFVAYHTYRLFGPGHQARKSIALAVFMTLLEGAIGAALVKFGWTNRDDSVARAGVMSFHVLSTFVLVGAAATTALLTGGAQQYRWRGQGALGGGVTLGYVALLFLGVSGAISALGHTLKPVDNVLGASIQAQSHWMVRLQPLHPLIATAIGLYLLLLGGLMIHLRPDPRVRRAVQWLVGLYASQMGLGVLSIWLKAPIWLQMVHLAMADVCFLAYVGCMVFAFGQGVARTEVSDWDTREILEAPVKGFRQSFRAYIALTKPRVISLLLFTTLTAMFIAHGGWPGLGLFLAVAVGGYCSAGAANAINMVIDRDIDASMKRTSTRPTVTQAVSSRNALYFAGALAVGSFAILWVAANLLTAVIALSGLVFYVVVYTMLLKRRTWHNIVIGGAAGAFPPMVGWAAVANELSPFAWWLFAIIFVWTPVHFWALAILIKDDYAKVGVPMLPVVHGVRTTVIQIAMYAALTALVSAMPLFQPEVGPIYSVSAAVLNLMLVVRTVQLYREPERPQAVGLYKYSMLYLALLFLMLAIDRSVIV